MVIIISYSQSFVLILLDHSFLDGGLLMAGHSKWSNIKHKKAKTDAQKGKQFSKVVREIMMAVKLGGPDPDQNPRLRLAVLKARDVNMPNDNVSRAIKKADEAGEGDSYEEVIYEGYGPFGVAILIETLTDNKNRTVPNIKAALTRGDGSLAKSGAVGYLFSKKGLILFEPGADEEAIMDVALEAGAEDVESKEDGSIEVVTEMADFITVKDAFDEKDILYVTAALTQIPSTLIAVTEPQAEQLIALIDKLEDDDDVQEVYANFEVAS